MCSRGMSNTVQNVRTLSTQAPPPASQSRMPKLPPKSQSNRGPIGAYGAAARRTGEIR